MPLNNPHASIEQFAQMNCDLDQDEILLAINQLKMNKTPGTDGLPIEFYRKI